MIAEVSAAESIRGGPLQCREVALEQEVVAAAQVAHGPMSA